MKNTLGNSVCVTVFGESHGSAVGAILDGLCAGVDVDLDLINKQLSKRRPNAKTDTPRVEKDNYQILSGVFNGKTTGTPICLVIPNENTKSADYESTKNLARPSHADYTAECKYNGYQDYRGGGHFSGRVTAGIVGIGAIAISALNKLGIKIGTHILKCGGACDTEFNDIENEIDACPEDIPLDIVYEDDDLAVINKPQGMTVHPAPGNYSGTLVNAILYHFKGQISDVGGNIRPGIVHRIDKDTSGLLVVAKNNKAHFDLAKQIAEKSCKRQYIALLEGVVKEDIGVINEPIGRSESDRKKMAVVPSGKHAVTHFEVLERFDGYTLMKFDLETGRTHQIRVHSKFIGHPIVGDKTYGYKVQKFKLDGQLLHARKLSFTHPTTKEFMTFESEIPDYFAKILKVCKN